MWHQRHECVDAYRPNFFPVAPDPVPAPSLSHLCLTRSVLTPVGAASASSSFPASVSRVVLLVVLTPAEFEDIPHDTDPTSLVKLTSRRRRRSLLTSNLCLFCHL